MILIADAGGTKTDWRLVDGSVVQQFRSAGFNVRSAGPDDLSAAIPPQVRGKAVQKLYFYGAGINDEQIGKSLKDHLQLLFPDALIETASDTLGAARSLFGRESGIACILGTGSAVSHYDGMIITGRIPSLGYIMGDEGGGFYLGKMLLRHHLRGTLPSGLSTKLEREYPHINEHFLLEKVYNTPNPNAFVADFARFVIENQADPYLYKLAYQSFQAFFEAYFGDFVTLKGASIRFTGSVAYFLSNILRKFAADHHLNVDLISQNPIAGLTLYHQQYG